MAGVRHRRDGGGLMDLDVFDPREHRIIAVARDGTHLHVTLHELALDAQSLEFPVVDLSPIERRIATLEASPPPAVAPQPVASDQIIRALIAKLEALEARITTIEHSGVDAQVRALTESLGALAREALKKGRAA